MEKNKSKFFFLVLAALIVRILLIFNTFVIVNDGPLYIKIAKMFSRGEFTLPLKWGYPPLYSFLVMLASYIFPSYASAGIFISILFSTLTIIPLFFLAKKLFSEKVAIISCVLFIFHPFCVIFGTGILTTSLYGFCAVTILLLIYKITKEDSLYLLFLTPFVILIGIFSRQDAILFIPVLFLGLIIGGFSKKYSYRKILLHLLLIAVVFIGIIGVFYFILNASGNNMSFIFNKGKLSALSLKIPEYSDIPVYSLHKETPVTSGREVYLRALFYQLNEFIGTMMHLLLPFLLFGIFFRKKIKYNFKNGIIFLSYFILFVLAGIFFTIYARGYTSRRHYLVLVILTLPWISVGFIEVSYFIKTKFKMIELNKILAVLIFIFLGALSIKTAKPLSITKVGEKETGLWLKDKISKKDILVTDMERIPFYADCAKFTHLAAYSGGEYSKMILKMKRDRVSYLVIDDNIHKYIPDFYNALNNNDLLKVKVFSKNKLKNKGAIEIYKVVYK